MVFFVSRFDASFSIMYPIYMVSCLESDKVAKWSYFGGKAALSASHKYSLHPNYLLF